jgi:hypothetical protein
LSEARQVIRFAVGSAAGPRSRTLRLWVPKGKSDVYLSSRRIASAVKVSLHEPGPARIALTSEFVFKGTFRVPEERDRRLAVDGTVPAPHRAVSPGRSRSSCRGTKCSTARSKREAT